MPGRGHKVASRQAQLGHRRRRQNRAAHTAPVGAARPTAPAEGGSDEGAATRSAVATAPASSPARSATAVQPQSRPTVTRYIGPELKRIVALAGVSVAVLVALGIVL